jgi:hypothetical protein
VDSTPSGSSRIAAVQLHLERSFVSLKLFDVLGREIATLVSQELDVGNYPVTWEAAAFASDVYFYRLQASPISGGQAGSFVETKKLVLLR